MKTDTEIKTPLKELNAHGSLYVPVAVDTVGKAVKTGEYEYSLHYYGVEHVINLDGEENRDSYVCRAPDGLCAYAFSEDGEEWELFTSAHDAFNNC